jgi:hypothetical protein
VILKTYPRAAVSASARVLRFFLRHNLRGQTRLRLFLSGTPGLHLVPVEIGDLPPVYMDLRLGDTAWCLKYSPHKLFKLFFKGYV